MLKRIISRILNKSWKKQYLNNLIRHGLQVGKNLSIQQGCIIDESHCWHIKIGDNVILAPNVHILAHDASTFNLVGYTKVKNVIIGNNVFIGAGSIILPGVTITDNVIVGAGSIVTKNIEFEGVYAGAPAKFIYPVEEYKNKIKKEMDNSNVFDSSYTLRNKSISTEMKNEMFRSCINNQQIFVQ